MRTQHCEVVNTASSVPVCSLWCVHAVIDPCFCRTAGVYTASQYIAKTLLNTQANDNCCTLFHQSISQDKLLNIHCCLVHLCASYHFCVVTIHIIPIYIIL